MTNEPITKSLVSEFDYPERRVREQSKWHSKEALRNKRKYHAVELLILVAGVLIPMASLLPADYGRSGPVATAILGGVIVVAGGAKRLFKFHENWLLYRAVSETLLRELELFRAAAGEYALENEKERNARLVERAESLLAGVTEQYLANHRTEKDSGDPPKDAGASGG
jgi:hypothetical protein